MASINTASIKAITGYNSLSIEFTTDEISNSVLNYTYTDYKGVTRIGKTSKASTRTDHIYFIDNLPHNTTVDWDIEARFGDGTTDTYGPDATDGNAVDTRNPDFSVNIRTADIAVPASEIRLQETNPELFAGNFRVYKAVITVDADTEIRFEENQATTTLVTGQKYEFFPVGDIFLTGSSNASIYLMPNPNF